VKITNLVQPASATAQVVQFLNNDKSGEVFTLSELAEKIPGLQPQNSSLRPSNPKLKAYTLLAASRGGRKTRFYGNPEVIARAAKYIRQESK
jgi:hypothetical protein